MGAPIMNFLTTELQTAYKRNRSTYDTLKTLRILLNDQDSERTITLMDLTKAFDKTNRQLLFNIQIKRGIFQGSPLSALLFIIYTDQMMKEFDKEWKEKKKTLGKKKENMIVIRNERVEREITEE